MTSLGQGWVRTSRGEVARYISAVETPDRHDDDDNYDDDLEHDDDDDGDYK